MSRENIARRQYLAARLAAHQATDNERDEALGTILLSLFSREDVEEIVDTRLKATSTPTSGKELSMKDWLIKELIRLLGLAIVIVGSIAGIKECFWK